MRLRSLNTLQGPDLVALDALARQVAQRVVLVSGARFSGVGEQFGDGVPGYVGDAGR
ncbi:MAG: hypothetical protein OXP66_17195 [Candidatus Tectomicrobia bacterium]|nr:hypothetical protein [Candidatus Tectomicrobia bacterium]